MIPLFVWVTSKCHGTCPRCSQGALMRMYPKYEMPSSAVQRVIDCVLLSAYRLDSFQLVGGEPLLWSSLGSAVKSLSAVAPVEFFTNGIEIEVAAAVAEHTRMFRVSAYDWNVSEVAAMERAFPGRVRVVDCRHHLLPPRAPIAGAGVCCGTRRGPLVFDDYVYPCCNAPAVAAHWGIALDKVPRVPLQPEFCEAMEDLDMTSFCRGCIGNLSIRHLLR